MAVIAYLLGLILGGGSFWILWKLLGPLRRRSKWGYYLAAAWAGAVAGILFTAGFYLTGQGDVLFDGPSNITRGEIIEVSVIVGVLLGVGMAWYATWQPSPLNDVDTDEGPWTSEFVREILDDAEHASPERRRQIAAELREMARDSRSRLPEELERHVVRWEREASRPRTERLP
jgi:hypothetical protein